MRIVRSVDDGRTWTREALLSAPDGTKILFRSALESPTGEPEVGRSFGLDVITTLGRDVNNAIVIDDPFASAEHAVLTFRGRTWYLEDLASTNGSFINGHQITGVAALGYGDEVQVGQVRLRLERL